MVYTMTRQHHEELLECVTTGTSDVQSVICHIWCVIFVLSLPHQDKARRLPISHEAIIHHGSKPVSVRTFPYVCTCLQSCPSLQHYPPPC